MALSSKDLDEFLDLPIDVREQYQVPSKYVGKLLAEELKNLNLVKAILLLMTPDPELSDAIIAAMMKYSYDREIQLCGLKQAVSDIDAVTRAAMFCGVGAIRHAIPSLRNLQEPLPPQLVDFLLTLDRSDVCELLLMHLDRQSESIIAAQFQLRFPNQLLVAKELTDRDLWLPSPSHYPLIINTLHHSLFDPVKLSAALKFSRIAGLTEISFPLLIDAMETQPHNAEIVATCGAFITKFPLSDDIGQVCYDKDVLSVVLATLDMHKGNEEMALGILKLCQFLAKFRVQIPFFANSLAIPRLVYMAKKSDRCRTEACTLFTDLCRNSSNTRILATCDVHHIVFDDPVLPCYELIDELVSKANVKLTDEETEVIFNEFTEKGSSLPPNDLRNLLHIIMKSLESQERQVSYKPIVQIMTAHIKDSLIIQYCARILLHSLEFTESEQLLFATLNALHENVNDHETVCALIEIIRIFAERDHYSKSLSGAFPVEVFTSILAQYPDDVAIQFAGLRQLQRRPESVRYALDVLRTHSDEAVLLQAAKCLSYSQGYGTDHEPDDRIRAVFNVLSKHLDSLDISHELMAVLYYGSDDDNDISYFSDNMEIIFGVLLRYVTDEIVSASAMGIMYNLSSRDPESRFLPDFPSYVALCLKVGLTNSDIHKATVAILERFLIAGEVHIFKNLVPIFILALRRQIQVPMVCASLCYLKDNIGNLSRPVAQELFELIHLLTEPDQQNVRIKIVACLQTIAKNTGVNDVICTRLERIMSLIDQCTDDDDQLATALLRMCASVSNPERMDDFRRIMEHVVDMIKEPKLVIACAAAELLSHIASHRREFIEPYREAIAEAGNRVGGGLLRLSLEI
jgi:hypothetical protein